MSIRMADAFQFCPHCGVRLAVAGRDPLDCGACGFRYHFTPVTGVVGLIVNPAGELLLLIRDRDPGRGLFGLPGGFVDAGETAEAALRREVLEEVNLTVSSLRYLGSFANDYHYRGAIVPVTDVVFRCEVQSLQPLRTQPGEVAGFRFCRPGPEELDRMAFQSNRRAVELFLRAASATEIGRHSSE